MHVISLVGHVVEKTGLIVSLLPAKAGPAAPARAPPAPTAPAATRSVAAPPFHRPFTAFHRLSTNFSPPFTALSPPFTAFPPTFHCLSPPFHQLFTAFHCLFTAFHRLSPSFHRLSPPFAVVLLPLRPGRQGDSRPVRRRLKTVQSTVFLMPFHCLFALSLPGLPLPPHDTFHW